MKTELQEIIREKALSEELDEEYKLFYFEETNLSKEKIEKFSLT